MRTSIHELFVLLAELIELTLLDDGSPQSFRARAYQRALRTLRESEQDVATLTEAQLTKLDGVGAATAKKVREYFATGAIDKLRRLRQAHPPGVLELSQIPGLGPKSLLRLRGELGIASPAALQVAINTQALRDVAGLGEKFEQRMVAGLARLAATGKQQRAPLSRMLPIAEAVVAELAALPDVVDASYCGSIRRLVPEVADVDVLVATDQPQLVARAFAELPTIKSVHRGDAAAAGMLSGETFHGVQVDLRLVAPEQYAAAQVHFTGSAAHNVRLRSRARERGFKLNEYGLWPQEADAEADGAALALTTVSEADVYVALGLQPIPAPMREDNGEIEASAARSLPSVPVSGEIRGDLHLHTSRSGDGRCSLQEMVAAAAELGLEYLAVTDHGENLSMNGVTREDLQAQREEIEQLRAAYPTVHLLQGVELNIAADGSLDYDAEVRAQLDWCVAAVHSDFDLDRDTQTRRIIAAMQDPAVNAIGHLVGRKIGHRPGISIDSAAVIDAAERTATAIEINSALPRLDAATELLLEARGRDVLVVINTDSHHFREYRRLEWGGSPRATRLGRARANPQHLAPRSLPGMAGGTPPLVLLLWQWCHFGLTWRLGCAALLALSPFDRVSGLIEVSL